MQDIYYGCLTFISPCDVLQVAVANATEMCPERLEVNQTVKSLDTEIKRLMVKITSKQDQQGNREEIVR